MSEYKFGGKTYSEESLKELTVDQLVALHNELAEALDAETRSGFRTKAAGVKAVLGLLVGYAAQKPSKGKKAAKADKEEKPKKKAAKEEEESEDETRGRKNSFAGKCFYPADSVKKEGNPYREDTLSWRTMELIINDPGISYEDLVEKNARMNTLRDSLRRELIVLK